AHHARASEPITVRAERVRQRTYRSRHGIAPLPPQTSLSAKCRTLSGSLVKAPSVNEKSPANVTAITLGPGHNRRVRLRVARPGRVAPGPREVYRPRCARPRAPRPRRAPGRPDRRGCTG